MIDTTKKPFALLRRHLFTGRFGLLALAIAVSAQAGVAASPPPQPAIVTAPRQEPTATPELASTPAATATVMPEASPTAGPPTPTSMPTAPMARMPALSPSGAGMQDAPIARIDDLMRKAIADGLFPGAVVLVARNGAIVKHQAYGYAALYASPTQRLDNPTPATTDTIFDIASVSKLFTAVAVMKLVEQGAVDVNAPVASYVPEFAANGKQHITVKHLLTHTGGLPPGLGNPASGDGAAEILKRAFRVAPSYPADTKRLYSDIDFIVLGEIVQRVSGKPLDNFVADQITAPLGMTDTMYRPPAKLLPRVAATEQFPPPRGMLRGTVHDTTAYYMGRVAGHAGLFSTTGDLAILGQLMLNGGTYGGQRILKPETVAAMTKLQVPASFGDNVGLGWELKQSWYMGGLTTPVTFGHTGYTGTSIVVNPQQQVVVILLTNRVHPSAKTKINGVRSQLADLVASALR